MPERKYSLISRVVTGSMRLFFRLLYHTFAWSYDLVAATVSLGRWKGWVQAALKLLHGPRVLELGYGPGHMQTYLRAAGWTPFGLDESRQMARQAYQRLRRGGHPPLLARGLAQHLPYASTSFDSVVATFPTLYIVDPLTLAEIYRVLKPGQRLVVLMAAWITGSSPADRVMRAVFKATAQVPPENQELSEHLKPYQQAGFQASLRFVDLRGARLLFILAARPTLESS